MMVGWLVDRMIGWLVVRIVCHKRASHKRGSCCVFLPYLFSWYPAGLIKYVLLISELIVTARLPVVSRESLSCSSGVREQLEAPTIVSDGRRRSELYFVKTVPIIEAEGPS